MQPLGLCLLGGGGQNPWLTASKAGSGKGSWAQELSCVSGKLSLPNPRNPGVTAPVRGPMGSRVSHSGLPSSQTSTPAPLGPWYHGVPIPHPTCPQLWEISSGELLLSVLFDVSVMAVTMDLAEHHMFCGGSDGSIFQVDLCTWVSDRCLGSWLEGVAGYPGSILQRLWDRPSCLGPCAQRAPPWPSTLSTLGSPGLRCHSVPLVTGSLASAAWAEREKLPAGTGQREGVQRPQVRGPDGEQERSPVLFLLV